MHTNGAHVLDTDEIAVIVARFLAGQINVMGLDDGIQGLG